MKGRNMARRTTLKQHKINVQLRVKQLENRDLYTELLDTVADEAAAATVSDPNKYGEATLNILKEEMEKRLYDWFKFNGYSSIV